MVERLTRDTGLLKIIEVNTVLFKQEVTLDYGAIFGPDINDIQKWMEIGINFVDVTMKLPKKEEEDPYKYRHICMKCGQSYFYAGYMEEAPHMCGDWAGFK